MCHPFSNFLRVMIVVITFIICVYIAWVNVAWYERVTKVDIHPPTGALLIGSIVAAALISAGWLLLINNFERSIFIDCVFTGMNIALIGWFSVYFIARSFFWSKVMMIVVYGFSYGLSYSVFSNHKSIWSIACILLSNAWLSLMFGMFWLTAQNAGITRESLKSINSRY